VFVNTYITTLYIHECERSIYLLHFPPHFLIFQHFLLPQVVILQGVRKLREVRAIFTAQDLSQGSNR